MYNPLQCYPRHYLYATREAELCHNLDMESRAETPHGGFLYIHATFLESDERPFVRLDSSIGDVCVIIELKMCLDLVRNIIIAFVFSCSVW